MYHFYCHHTYAQVTETAHIDAEAEKLLFADPQAVGNYAVCMCTILYHHYSITTVTTIKTTTTAIITIGIITISLIKYPPID
jgi:hypothetical protein